MDGKDEKFQNDFETTVFIGNLPFITNEEDLRAHFDDLEEGGSGITNVRIIRDPKTFIGKGIAYVQFKNKDLMRKAVNEKHESRFNGRPIRVKKAVEAKRLEKKKLRKEERAAGRAADRQDARENAAEIDTDIHRMRNFEQAAYGGGDSEEEQEAQQVKKDKERKKLKQEKQAKQEFEKQKAIEKDQKLQEQFNMINKKSTASADKSGPELDITNRLGHKKEVHKKIMKQKLESASGKSKFEESKNKETFKE